MIYPLAIQLLFVVGQAAEQQCYWRSNGVTSVVQDSGWFSCNRTEVSIPTPPPVCLLTTSTHSKLRVVLNYVASKGRSVGWTVYAIRQVLEAEADGLSAAVAIPRTRTRHVAAPAVSV